MKKLIIASIAMMLVIVSAGCSRRLTDFTVISTKNIPIGEGVHTDFQKGTKRVKGQDVAHVVLAIPFGYPNMKEAIDKAIEQIPGAIGLVDGVVKSQSWTCLVYGQNKFIVEGTPLFPTDFNYEEANLGRPESYNKGANKNKVAPESSSRTEKANTYIFYHEVKDGENLPSLSKQYNVSIGDLIKWNKLSESNIRKGQKLEIHITE